MESPIGKIRQGSLDGQYFDKAPDELLEDALEVLLDDALEALLEELVLEEELLEVVEVLPPQAEMADAHSSTRQLLRQKLRCCMFYP